MSKTKTRNDDALKIIRAEIREAQRRATVTKQIIEREQDFLKKEEIRIQNLKLAESQLESAYD
jgi:hypothetical protein